MNTHAQRFINWLLDTNTGGVVLWLLERVALVVGALCALFIVYSVERHFAPVIKDWRLDYVERVDGDYVIAGTMFKSRACELISTSVMAVPKASLAPRHLIFQIKPNEIIGGNAPTGSSTWGPWQVPIPKGLLEQRDKIAFLEVVGHHKCHGLWSQETLYGRVPMERLP